MTTTIDAAALSDRIHLIYDDCGGRHDAHELHDGVIFNDHVHLSSNTAHEYQGELRGIFDELAPEIHSGCSWQALMFEPEPGGDRWVNAETVTELLALGFAAGLVLPLTVGKVKMLHLNVSIMQQPWYRATF